MGLKLLSLQTIPWCFQMMGNHLSCLHIQPEPPAGTIKLIKTDGFVKIYDRPVHVSELMMEFPKHMVCRSDSFYIGQKIPALSEDDKLQLGHKYFLLPKHFFQSVLSFVTVASLIASSQSSSSGESRNALVKKAATCQPFHIHRTPSGCLRIRVSDEFISQLMEEGKIVSDEEESSSKPKSRVCTTAQLQKEYTQLVGPRQWKPKLETIRESEKKRKLSSFGMKRRKKSQAKCNQRSQRSSDHEMNRHVASTETPSKSKIIRFRARKGWYSHTQTQT